MNKPIGLLAGCALALLSIAAVRTFEPDVKIDNADNTVALTIQKGALTANFMEGYIGSTLKFKVPAAGLVSIGGVPARIEAVNVIPSEDNTVTQAWTTAFSAVPVVAFGAGVSNHAPHIISITSSNIVLGAADTNIVRVIAVGL